MELFHQPIAHVNYYIFFGEILGYFLSTTIGGYLGIKISQRIKNQINIQELDD